MNDLTLAWTVAAHPTPDGPPAATQAEAPDAPPAATDETAGVPRPRSAEMAPARPGGPMGVDTRSLVTALLVHGCQHPGDLRAMLDRLGDPAAD